MKVAAAPYAPREQLHPQLVATSPSNFWFRAITPNLATLAAITALFCTLFLFHGYRELFRDSDTGRHIQVGEEILSTGRVPFTDADSFSKPGAPFFDWEWLADVAMAGVNRVAGLSGIALFYALAFAACMWLWVRLTWQAGGTVLLAAPLLVPMLTGIDIHLLARPHILSWFLLLVAVIFFSELKSPLGWKQALQIFFLSLVWTNLHASFFLLIVVGGIYTASAYLERLIWRESSALPPRVAAQATLIAAAATLLNPYGWRLYQHLVAFLQDRTLFDTISEYRSLDFHLPGSGFVIAALAFTAAGATLAVTQRKLAPAFLCFLFFTQAVRSVRMIPLLALVCLPLAAGALTQALRSAADLQPRVRRLRDHLLTFGDQVRQLDRTTGGWLIALCAVFVAAFFLRLPSVAAATGFPKDVFPVAAAQAVAQLPAAARIFSSDSYGSYLIYRFAGKRKVFFDGRGDFYGPDFFEQYSHIQNLDPGWPRIWSRWHFSHALLPNNSPLIAALQKRQWHPLYRDSYQTLLAAPNRSSTHTQVIER